MSRRHPDVQRDAQVVHRAPEPARQPQLQRRDEAEQALLCVAEAHFGQEQPDPLARKLAIEEHALLCARFRVLALRAVRRMVAVHLLCLAAPLKRAALRADREAWPVHLCAGNGHR